MRVDEQVRASRPDRSVLLSASAGSGKTRALVRRFIHLLGVGAAPEEIAAITFTEKAAAQMKDRLFGALEEAAWGGTDTSGMLELGPSDAPYPIKLTPEEMLSSLVSNPDSLKVSTIHAFCLSLLRRFPLEAGLPADFSVMDEAEALFRRDRAVEECIEAIEAGELADEYRTVADAGYRVGAVKELLALSLSKRAVLTMLEVEAGGFDGLITWVRGLAPEARPEQLAVLAASADRLAAFMTERGIGDDDYVLALQSIAALKDTSGVPDVFRRMKKFVYTNEGSLRKGTPLTVKAAKRAVKDEHDSMFFEVRDALDEVVGDYDSAIAAGVLTSFLKLYKNTAEMYEGMNRRDGLVDFDDLEICAYRLLSGPHAYSALSRMEARIAHYLIDEFQDTSDIQWGIIKRLNEETFAGQGVEGPKAPTIFAVGDKKQSIYRFRRANHRLMDVLKRKMEQSIAPGRRDFPELDKNFRSAPQIVAAVNDLFGALFGDGYTKAEAVRAVAEGSVSLTVTPAGREAEALAEQVERAVGLPVWDEDAHTLRPAKYGDMAILLRKRAGLKGYEEALVERGIPFKVVGGVGFFVQDEVRAILGILGFLEDPADLLSLAAGLKSPVFRLSDGDIEPLYKSPEPMDALRAISPDAHRLILSWRGICGLVPTGCLTETIIRESAALLSFGMSSGPAALLNLEKLVGIAREYDRNGGTGLSGFSEWIKSYKEKTEMPTADVELPGYEDFVSVMTVHAAKGLEFPVVFLPGAAKKSRNVAPGFIVSDAEDGGVEMAIGTDSLLKENPQYKRLKCRENDESESETARLLYVAMTRAKDHLRIIAEDKDDGRPPAKGSWLRLITDASPAHLLRGEIEPPARMEAVAPAVTPPDTATEMPDLVRLAPLPVPEGIIYTSPSRLVRALPEESKGDNALARLRGLLIHSALESFGKSGSYDMRAIAFRTEGVDGLSAQAAGELIKDAGASVDALLSEARFRDLLTGGSGRYFELPLMMMRGSELIEGKADLVIVEGNSARVIDYKTGYLDTPIEALRQAYAPQLAAYSDAVKGAFGLKTVSAYLLLVDKGKLVEV